jgi:hypothetical protein
MGVQGGGGVRAGAGGEAAGGGEQAEGGGRRRAGGPGVRMAGGWGGLHDGARHGAVDKAQISASRKSAPAR